jgi:hypothetical protein
MNANENALTSHARMNRIKVVSRMTRWVFLGFFIYTLWFCFWPVLLNIWNNYRATHSIGEAISPGPHLGGLLNLAYPMIVAVWYWKLAQLFRFYERGLIFAAETIHTLKVLGILCAVSGIAFSIVSLTNKLFFPPHLLPPNVTVTVTKSYQLGFFNFDFGTGIDFGALMAGILIVIIAWIMDEGRKIQEEQALTV